jgi:hypothetical protein
LSKKLATLPRPCVKSSQFHNGRRAAEPGDSLRDHLPAAGKNKLLGILPGPTETGVYDLGRTTIGSSNNQI